MSIYTIRQIVLGKDPKVFHIYFSENYFKKGNVFNKLEVIKVYDNIWWRRLFRFFNIIDYTYKVKVKEL